MNRREFIKGLAAGFLLFPAQPMAPRQGIEGLDLSLVQGDPPSEVTREALAAFGGMERFVSKGDIVLVKPNIAWERAPEYAGCTNPVVVKTLVELCVEAGASKVIVMDNPVQPAPRTYARSGIAEAARKAGAEVLMPGRESLKKARLGGEWLKEWMILREFLESDKIINVPILKTHGISRLTMGMKNWLGACGGNRQQFHQALDRVVVDLAAFFKPALTVLDAYRVLVRNGPRGGSLSDVKLFGTVVVGPDPVAVDAMGASFFGLKAAEIRYLSIARDRGLGEYDFDKLRIFQKAIYDSDGGPYFPSRLKSQEFPG